MLYDTTVYAQREIAQQCTGRKMAARLPVPYDSFECNSGTSLHLFLYIIFPSRSARGSLQSSHFISVDVCPSQVRWRVSSCNLRRYAKVKQFFLFSIIFLINQLNPFRTAVSFWGQLGANYLELEWFVPKTGMEF